MSNPKKCPFVDSPQFTVFMHVISWLFIFLFPHFLYAHDNENDLFRLSRVVYLFSGPIIMAIVFYVNYFWLAPQYAIERKFKQFVLFNILIFILGLIAIDACTELSYFIRKTYEQDSGLYWYEKIRHGHKHMHRYIFFRIRDLVTFTIMALIPCIIHMGKKWKEAENAREQAELERSQAELQSLKNQISPHFLLNTLNNIYALIEFNQAKAKTAILDLSRLLQHLLYTKQDQFIPLSREVDILQHYVELMKIRLSDNVKLETNLHISASCQMTVAPLIFISLVENAFKHGLSPTEESRISITLNTNESEGTVELDILNSNHPKNEQDKSGHGIGLEQVQRRLDILYEGRYQWTKGIDETGQFYRSRLLLHTKES